MFAHLLLLLLCQFSDADKLWSVKVWFLNGAGFFHSALLANHLDYKTPEVAHVECVFDLCNLFVALKIGTFLYLVMVR